MDLKSKHRGLFSKLDDECRIIIIFVEINYK